MGRRHDEERTRQNRTRQYPGGYDRHGYDERGYDRRGYGDRNLFGPYYDSRGNLFYEDREGYRHYEERPPDPYDRDYERDRYERDGRQSTGRSAIKWGGIVAVALILVVGMVMATSNLTSGPSDSAQQAPQQAPQQQPVQPQQPQVPAAPQQDGASAEQVEGMRADLERQLAEIRQSINQLRLEIWSFFTSQQSQQQEEPAQ